MSDMDTEGNYLNPYYRNLLNGFIDGESKFYFFQISSIAGTKKIGKSIASVFALSNRPNSPEYDYINFALRGPENSGKSTFSTSVVKAYDDLTIVRKSTIKKQFLGTSPSMGHVWRADYGYGKDSPKVLSENLLPNTKSDFNIQQGLNIIEHANAKSRKFHCVVDIDSGRTDVRDIVVVCATALTETEGFKSFLKNSESYRYG